MTYVLAEDIGQPGKPVLPSAITGRSPPLHCPRPPRLHWQMSRDALNIGSFANKLQYSGAKGARKSGFPVGSTTKEGAIRADKGRE